MIWVGGVAGALGAIALVLRHVVVRPLQNWIREQTEAAREVAAELRPNENEGGGSVRDMLGGMSEQLTSMQTEMQETRAYSEQTREMAVAALSMARSLGERFDRWESALFRNSLFPGSQNAPVEQTERPRVRKGDQPE